MNYSDTYTIKRTIKDDNHVTSVIKVESTIFRVKSMFCSNVKLQEVLLDIAKESWNTWIYDEKSGDKSQGLSYNNNGKLKSHIDVLKPIRRDKNAAVC